MNIKHTLRFLVDYYQATRQAGHTLTMIHGAARSPGVAVVAIGRKHGEMIRDFHLLQDAEVVGLPEVERLHGMSAPLAFDNGALVFLFDQAATRIAQLEADNEKLHAQLMRVL